jgi:hypothetical protein
LGLSTIDRPVVATDFVPKLGLPTSYQNSVHATSTVTTVPSLTAWPSTHGTHTTGQSTQSPQASPVTLRKIAPGRLHLDGSTQVTLMYTLGPLRLVVNLHSPTQYHASRCDIPVHWQTVYGKAGNKQSQGIHMHKSHATYLMF